MSFVTSPEVINELHRIAEENSGILRAEDVVKSASRKNSPLHSSFTWDDSEAAHQWRLTQARQLIRVTVTYIGDAKQQVPMRVFVSLSTDRESEGGGYRSTVSVLANKNFRQQMLEDAVADMERFEKKYETLAELTEVFDAMRRARQPVAASR